MVVKEAILNEVGLSLDARNRQSRPPCCFHASKGVQRACSQFSDSSDISRTRDWTNHRMPHEVDLPSRISILDRLHEDLRSLLDGRRGWDASDEDLGSVGFEDLSDSSPVRDLKRRKGCWAEDVKAEELKKKKEEEEERNGTRRDASGR